MHQRGAPQQALSLFPSQEVAFYECGRDLFTFVTVASSHIMRTLQRPKKSRPTKRKVNHRRFLQNQICRKYADIEAATQQLATTIMSQEVDTDKRTVMSKNHGNLCPTEICIIPSDALGKELRQPSSETDGSVSTIKLPTIPENSIFLGVAEAFLVPDASSATGLTMENLTYGSDEVNTAENLFDDIVDAEELPTDYCALSPILSQSRITQNSLVQGRSELVQEDNGFLLCRKSIVAWMPEVCDIAILQLPDDSLTCSARESTPDFSSNNYCLNPTQTSPLFHPLLPNMEINQPSFHSNGNLCFADKLKVLPSRELNTPPTLSEPGSSHSRTNDYCHEIASSSWQYCLPASDLTEMDQFFSAPHHGMRLEQKEFEAGSGGSPDEPESDAFSICGPNVNPEIMSYTRSGIPMIYDHHLTWCEHKA